MTSLSKYADIPGERERLAAEELAILFRRAGWRVIREREGDYRPDLIIERKRKRYIVELKVAPEGRRDRLLPLLSQAILQAQAMARHSGMKRAQSMAIVMAPHVSAAVAEDLVSFASDVAADVVAGVVDQEGRRRFSASEFQDLEAEPSPHRLAAKSRSAPSSGRLFSDLNQWMLKLLLAPRIPEHLLNGPRSQYRNASELAKAADVSVMSAFRFVSQLRSELLLAEFVEPLQVVRVEELLRRWAAANHGPWREFPMRWIAGEVSQPPDEAVRNYIIRREENQKKRKSQKGSLPRVCLGLFSAARAFDLSFVHGAPQHLYIEEVHEDALKVLGVRPARERVDLYLRVPRAPESVFRAAVHHRGLLVADALQIWLDLLEHPARGAAQAEEIKRRAFSDLLSSGAGL